MTSEGAVRITPLPSGQDWPSVPGLQNSSRSRVTNHLIFPATEWFLAHWIFYLFRKGPDNLDELVTIDGKYHLLQMSRAGIEESCKPEASLHSWLHSYLDAPPACPVLLCPTSALFHFRS